MRFFFLSPLVFSFVLLMNSTAQAQGGRRGHIDPTRYPEGPLPDLTPGELCKQPSEFRYPERIPYCNRKVSVSLKKAVREAYDARLGTQTSLFKRRVLIIDHLIPLCMGGSNGALNLWPQHEKVGEVTTVIEDMLCRLMEAGKLRQAPAIDLILRAKRDPEQIRPVYTYAQAECRKYGLAFGNRR